VLHDVAWNGNAPACEMLLKSKAFGNEEGMVHLETHNNQGQTAMHVAAFRSPKALVMHLTEAGADVMAVEKNGRRLSKETPEDMAMAMGREDTAKYLRELSTATNAVKFAARMKMKKGGAAGAAEVGEVGA